MSERREDLAGKKFGRLEVLNFSSVTKGGHAKWRCKCDCGTIVVTAACRLKNGRARSCGCLCKDLVRQRSLTHGLTVKGAKRPPEYQTWISMVSRCHSPTSQAARRYHDRGIKVCDRWRDSYEAFLADMGPRPSPDLSIDRINNDGDYEPANCRWATRSQQQRNKGNHLHRDRLK